MQVNSIQNQYNSTSFTALKPFCVKSNVGKVIKQNEGIVKSNLNPKKINFDNLSIRRQASFRDRDADGLFLACAKDL